MRAASEKSKQAALEVLHRELSDSTVPLMEVAENLFGVSDLLRDHSKVRMAISDPGRSVDDKVEFVSNLLQGGVEPATIEIVSALARGSWSDPQDVATACEYLGTEAVFVAADREGEVQDVQRELFAVGTFIGKHRDLRIGLSDLGVGSAHDRAHFAARFFGSAINPFTSRLLRRAVRLSVHGRLASRLRELIRLAANRRGHLVATVTVAAPLTDEQHQRLTELLTRRYNQPVALHVRQDPSLLGGLKVEVGTDAINASVRSTLTQARRALA